MQLSSIPARIAAAFAGSAPPTQRNTVPLTAAGTTQPGQAAFDTGFPPVTMQPAAAGGINPYGQDFNGIFYAITAQQKWQAAGGFFPYDSAFSGNVGGYPKGAILLRADGSGFWLSRADNNTSNPDAGGANWVPFAPGWIDGVDTGAANAYAVAFTPPVTALIDGMVLRFKALTANTGASTLNVNGLGAKSLLGAANTALQGGEIAASGLCQVVWSATLNAFVLIECTGGAVQVAPATQSQQAPQFGQVLSTYGVRGLVAGNNVGTPNTQFDIRANAVAFRNPTTGATTVVTNVASITNNILTAGPAANGRDQAGAFAASSWVHFYFIYNPTTSTVATISSAAPPPAGPTLPAGYTAWAYVGADYLNGSSQLLNVSFRGAWATYSTAQSIIASGTATVRTAVSLTTVIPPNALEFRIAVGQVAITSTAAGDYGVTFICEVIATAIAWQCGTLGRGGAAAVNTGAAGGQATLPNIGQNLYYYHLITSGTSPASSVLLSAYKMPNGGE